MNNEEIQYATGCLLAPAPLYIASVESLLGDVALPDNFIVPYYRKYFVDENGNYLDPSDPRWGFGFPIKNQRAIPSCVGESTSYAKAADEGQEMSGRDAYRLAKRKDGSTDPTSWGTTIWAAIDAQIDTGIASTISVPDTSDESVAAYVSLDDVDTVVENDRAGNKALRGYIVDRALLLQTIFQTEKPVVTSTMWWDGDHDLKPGGLLPAPAGNQQGGHAVCWIGFITVGGRKLAVVPNSWSAAWGNLRGFFLVDVADANVMNRFGTGYVSVDIAADLADVLTKYDKKNVQVAGDARIYHIEGGKAHHFANEIVFWAFGFLFGQDVVSISADELAAVPIGDDMDITKAPARTTELVRQIRQFYGKL